MTSVLVPRVLTTRAFVRLLFDSNLLVVASTQPSITWSERRSGKPLRLGGGTVASGKEKIPDNAGAFRNMSFGAENGSSDRKSLFVGLSQFCRPWQRLAPGGGAEQPGI